MYSFLLILGIIILTAGFYIERKELKALIREGPNIKVQAEPELDQELKERLKTLEDIVYSAAIEVENKDMVRQEISEEEFLAVLERQKEQVKIENLDIEGEMKEQFKLIADYESGILTLEEVSKELKMKKGEVLLLKNIYKKYQE
jgi:hypothetical protein